MFLDIKFSHKLDYPGCLEVAEPEVSIQEDRLLFTGLCSRSNQRIKISLDLELHNKIVPESSTYNLNSAGRLQVTLKKVENEAWPKPNKGKKLNNVHTWWEMREKFKKQMNELTGETDDDEINPKKKKTKSGLEDLIDNPNVVIKDSYIDGQKIDNSKDRNDL